MKIRHLGTVDYVETANEMQRFTASRDESTEDELWICQHPPVFTLGQAGKIEHVLVRNSNIPVVSTNRGGQVTYHGPGQIVAYPLINLRRRKIFVRQYVQCLEEAVIRSLARWNVQGLRVDGAPGVYVALQAASPDLLNKNKSDKDEAKISDTPSPQFQNLGKIAALGVKVQRHYTYHGLAFNVDMDLKPYLQINPCGYQGLNVVDLKTIGVYIDCQQAQEVIAQELYQQFAS